MTTPNSNLNLQSENKSKKKGSTVIRIVLALITAATAITVAHFANKTTVDPSLLPKYVAGRVIDRLSGAGVPGVTLKCIGRNESYYTDGDGDFKIEFDSDIPKNVRVVIEEFNGYKRYDDTHDLPNPELLIPLDLLP